MTLTSSLMAARQVLCNPAGQRAILWSCPPKGDSCGAICRAARRTVGGAISAGIVPALCVAGGRPLVERTIKAVCAGDAATAEAQINRAQLLAQRAQQVQRTLSGVSRPPRLTDAFADFFNR